MNNVYRKTACKEYQILLTQLAARFDESGVPQETGNVFQSSCQYREIFFRPLLLISLDI